MATKKKPSAKQLAARAKFVAMVRAKSKAKKSATKKAAPKKKSAPRKVTGLDKVVRKGRKTSVQYSRIAGLGKPPKLRILSKRELSKMGWAFFQHSGGAKYIINKNHTVKFTALSETTLRKKASEYLSNL